MPTPLSPAVVEALSVLTEEQQLVVIALAKQAGAEESAEESKPLLTREERIRGLAAIAGSMPKKNADEMMAIINEGCGQINSNAW